MINEVVFITRHDPSKTGGGSYATRAYLESINLLFPNQVTLFVADTCDVESLNFKSKNIILVPSRNPIQFLIDILFGNLSRFKKTLNNWLKFNKAELVILDGGIIGGSFSKLFKLNGAEVITIHHNFEIDYHKDNQTIESIFGKYLFWIKHLEKNAYLFSDKNLFLTTYDMLCFENIYGIRKNNFVLGCFEYFNDNKLILKINPKRNGNVLKVVISGSLNSPQTQNSFFWFVNTIFIKLRKQYKNMELTLTGRSPSIAIVRFCKFHNITLVESPKNILEELAKHDIYICPVKLGGGLKLRVMDALKIGMPCIIQNTSYRGYEEMESTRGVINFNNELDFFVQFEKLIREIKNNKNINYDIAKKYQSIFAFKNGMIRMEQLINFNVND